MSNVIWEMENEVDCALELFRRRLRSHQLAGNYQPLHFARPLADRAELGIAPVFFGRIIFGVAVPAVNLNRLFGYLDRDLRGVELGHRRLLSRLALVVFHPCGAQCEQSRGVDLHGHVGEFELDSLEVEYRLAKLFALLRVFQGRFVGALRYAERQRCYRDAPAVQNLHGVDEAAPGLADQILLGNPAILEDHRGGLRGAHAELVLLLAGDETFGPSLDDEGADAARTHLAVGDRDHYADVGGNAVRDEILRPINNPASVAARGDRLHTRSVGAGSGLGQSPRANLFASGQRRDVFFALRLAAVLINVIRAERIVRGERQADRPVDARDLFDYRGVFHIPHPRAAVLFGKEHAHQPKLAHLCENLARQSLGLVPLHHVRFDLRFGEFTNRTFDLQLLLGQIKSHRHPNSSSFN